MLKGKRIGLGITASHCTYEAIIPVIDSLKDAGATVVPVITHSVLTAATRFGTGEEWIARIEAATGEKVISTIVGAEPFGPKTPVDCMIIAPMTGNSMSRFANAATDSPVLMAAKATLRNESPVLLGISTNDALGLNAMNLMKLLQYEKCLFYPVWTGRSIKETKLTYLRFYTYGTCCSCCSRKKTTSTVINYS